VQGPYTYALDGFPGNVTGATSGIFTGLSAGLYTVTVTDNNTGDPFGPCTRQSLPVFINNPIPLAVNLVGFNKQICIGDDPTTITQIANPVGGIGIYTYQWQDSIVGGVYTNIAGALSATFDPPAITQTTYYRRLLSSGSCATLASDPVEIKVNPLPEITNVTAPAFLCENSAMIVFYDFAPGQAPFFFSYTQETIDQSGAVIATKIVTDEISGDSKPVIQSPFVDDVRITVTGLRDFNGCVANPALFPPHQRYVEVLKNSAAFTATAATQCTGSAFTVQWNANPEVQYTFKWTEGPDAVFGPGLTGPQSDSRILNSFNTTGIQSLPIILTATNTLHLSNPLAPDCGVATHLENITIFPTIIPNIVVIEDKLCSGNAVQVTNSTSGGDFHTWTITRTNDGQVEPGFPITDNSALSKSFVINNTTAFNPATYEIRYDISNDPALGNGNCTNSATVTFDVYTEVVAKIGSPKDPAQTIQRWGESDAGDAGVMGVDGSGNFMRIDFENASTPVPPAAGIEYTWVFSNNNANTPPQTFNNINANPFFYNYRNPGIGKRANLTVTNLAAIGNVPGGCSDTDQFIFEIEIPPIVADFRVSRSMICLSDTITVTNLSTPLFNVWSIVNESTGGIPMTSNAFEPIFSLTEAGRYRISLKVRNPDFPDEDAFYTHATDQFVDAYDKPDASFITSPFPNVFVPDQELKTDNRSQTAFDPITDTFWPISYEWDFGDGRVEVSGNNPSISDPNSFHSPVHQYKTESQYIIYLTAYNDHPIDNPIIRCSSRDSVIINARAGGTTKVPNAFTPNPGGPTGGIVDDNGTTINDVFLPITKGVQEFKMQIFDRWGNLIFESNNRNQGWDGYDRNGNLVPAGVYVYKLVLRMSNDVRTTQVGDVTLIR
jgi:gliding motility-associated-like protein